MESKFLLFFKCQIDLFSHDFFTLNLLIVSLTVLLSTGVDLISFHFFAQLIGPNLHLVSLWFGSPNRF